MEALECKICLLEYSENDSNLTPRILNCGHTICESCAKSLHENENCRKLVCPFCRTETNTSNIEQLPKNFSIVEVLRERVENEQVQEKPVIEVERDPDSNHVPCAEKAEHDAVWFCENCDHNFCESCFASTQTSRVLATHTKIPVSQRPFQLPKCKSHPKNTAEFLCCEVNCHIIPKAICHTCLLTAHRNHYYEELMPKIMDKTELIKDILEQVQTKKTNAKSEVAILEDCSRAFDENGEAFQERALKIGEFFEAQKEIALEKFTEYNRKKREEFMAIQTNLQVDVTMLGEIEGQLQSVLAKRSNFDFEEADSAIGNGSEVAVMQTANVENMLSLLNIQVVLPENVEVHFYSL